MKGEARGEARGRIEGLQEAIGNFLHIKFPVLAATSQARQAVASVRDVEELKQLQRALLLVSDERAVRALLKLPTQGDLI